jgi:phosphoribosylpyrophosphate synthetase
VNIDGHSSEFAQQLEQVGIEVINITSAFVLIEELMTRGLMDDSLENVICGVDFGNLALTQKISQRLKLKLAIIRKTREPTIRGEDSETKHPLVYGDVRGKRVVLMDDMISSGGTIIETVNLLLAAGAKEILVCAAHAVFAGRNYYKTMVKLLKIPEVKIVMTTDTLPLKRPGFGRSRSLPYAILPGVATADKSEPAEVIKQVEMLPLDGFIGQIVQALMATHNAAEIRAILAEHIVEQRDPYEIYE